LQEVQCLPVREQATDDPQLIHTKTLQDTGAKTILRLKQRRRGRTKLGGAIKGIGCGSIGNEVVSGTVIYLTRGAKIECDRLARLCPISKVKDEVCPLLLLRQRLQIA
jgi:hypothetical protein